MNPIIEYIMNKNRTRRINNIYTISKCMEIHQKWIINKKFINQWFTSLLNDYPFLWITQNMAFPAFPTY